MKKIVHVSLFKNAVLNFCSALACALFVVAFFLFSRAKRLEPAEGPDYGGIVFALLFLVHCFATGTAAAAQAVSGIRQYIASRRERFSLDSFRCHVRIAFFLYTALACFLNFFFAKTFSTGRLLWGATVALALVLLAVHFLEIRFLGRYEADRAAEIADCIQNGDYFYSEAAASREERLLRKRRILWILVAAVFVLSLFLRLHTYFLYS